jgi:protocatechuate 3,4-dioxygenase beta subunit
VIVRAAAVALTASAAALVVGLGSASSQTTASCRPSQSLGGGPFETSGAAFPKRSRIGHGHVLTGRVLRFPGCAPIKGAVVDFWQESPNGSYGRRGQASVVTGRTGAFRFEGPRPPAEGGRPAHIHIRVTAGGYVDFVTTFFLRPGEKSGRITIVLVSGL